MALNRQSQPSNDP